MPPIRYLHEATARIEAALKDPKTGVAGISFGWHFKSISELKPPPRIVWVRTQSNPGTITLPGVRKALRSTIDKGLDCIIWGKDDKQLEQLEERLVAEFEKQFPGGASKFVLGYPFEDQINRSNQSTQGEAFVYRFTVACYAQDSTTDSELATGPFTPELQTTGGTIGDGIIDSKDEG